MMHSRTLGPLTPPAWHRPHFRYFAPVDGDNAGTPGAPGAPATPAAPSAPAAPQAPAQEPGEVDWKAKYEETLGHSRTWEQRAKENKEKADKFDTAEQEKLSEIEKANLRANTAEQTAALTGAELLQLQAAVDHGITKDERALLTGSTAEAIAAQVESILKLRAPATATAQDAGITGGGAGATTTRAGSLSEAVSAAVTKK